MSQAKLPQCIPQIHEIPASPSAVLDRNQAPERVEKLLQTHVVPPPTFSPINSDDEFAPTPTMFPNHVEQFGTQPSVKQNTEPNDIAFPSPNPVDVSRANPSPLPVELVDITPLPSPGPIEPRPLTPEEAKKLSIWEFRRGLPPGSNTVPSENDGLIQWKIGESAKDAEPKQPSK